MEKLNNKATNGELSANEWNGTRSEVQNIIENAGLTLSAGDQNQLGKAIADYVGNAGFYTDSGTANAHVLTSVSTNQSPTALKDGLKCRYRVNVTNTGATTVAVAGLTAKAVTINNAALVAGELVAGQSATLEYHSGNDAFNIISTEAVGGYRVNGWFSAQGSYDSKSKSVASEDVIPSGVFFKPDGTKMYMIGVTSSDVFQYSLSVPWDVSTATYDTVFLSVTSEDTSPQGVFFKPDGLKMYVMGLTNDTVYQYSLSTAWVLTGATYDSVSFSVTGQDITPDDIFFKPDGTKMYMIGSTSDTVYQYTLPTPWVLTGMSYDTVSFSIATEEGGPTGIFFKPDGTKMYMVGSVNDIVHQYSLPTPWVLTGMSYDSVFLSVAGEDITPKNIFFKPNGDKMYMVGSANDTVYQYSTNFLSAPV